MATELGNTDPIAEKISDKPRNKGDEYKEKKLTVASEEDSSDTDSECLENIDVSDSEEYVPPVLANTQSDESDSSGDEEIGVRSEEIANTGECKLYKLKFDEVEAKRKERLEKMAELNSASDEEETDKESNSQENADKLHGDGKESYSNYRNILDEDMEGYTSQDDGDYNPLSFEETLTDDEYQEGDEHDTESEPEVDDLNEKHKKTGETLKCIRMIEQLNIPPKDISPSTSNDDQTPMEYS